MSLFTALTVLFVGLKLARVISWSWWLVLSPTLAIGAFVVLAILMAAVVEATK